MKEGWFVALHLEDHREPVADVDDPGVFPGPCRTRGPFVGNFLRWIRELL